MEYDYMTRTLQDTLCTIYISSLWIWFIVSETQSLVWPDNKFRGTHIVTDKTTHTKRVYAPERHSELLR